MKNIRITFRLSPYQLARGLQTIRQLEPSYKLISLNDIVKTIYHDYLAKMSLNKLDAVPPNITAEITNFIDKPSEKQLTVKELIDINELTPAQKSSPEPEMKPASEQELSPIQKDLSDEILAGINKIAEINKASKFNDPNNTDSDISTVTDFSPPKDWIKE